MSLTTTRYNTTLPADLRALQTEIEGHARSYGLDFYETKPCSRSEAGNGPCLWPLRLFQEQCLFRPHQPQDDERNGEPRQPGARLRGKTRRGRGRTLHRPVPVD